MNSPSSFLNLLQPFSNFLREHFIFLALSFLVLYTRIPHSFAFHFPDASISSFFVIGFLSQTKTAKTQLTYFLSLTLLTVFIDLYACFVTGISSYCLTWAYLMLPATYFITFTSGIYSFNHFNKIQILAFSFLVYIQAFLTSNLSFYLFSGYFDSLSLAEYFSSVFKFSYSYVGNSVFYTFVTLLPIFMYFSITKARTVLAIKRNTSNLDKFLVS